MEIALLVISILLIIIVLLQSGKAESAGQIMNGGNSDLFANRKERGLELFISRLTMLLGVVYFSLALFIILVTETVPIPIITGKIIFTAANGVFPTKFDTKKPSTTLWIDVHIIITMEGITNLINLL